MPTLLVVGGSGYLGAAVLARARDTGARVHATRARSSPDASPGVSWHQLDLRCGAGSVGHLIGTVAPDAVVNLAYVRQGADLEAVTATGAALVAAAAVDVGSRLVHLSSDVVFDGRLGRPYVEQDPTTPVTDYGRAKARAEDLVAATHPGAALVRTSLLYGGPSAGAPGSHERLVLDVCDGRAEVAFFSDEMRCPAQVDDVAAVVVELAIGALDRVRGPVHVVGADRVSRLRFAELVAAANGHDPTKLVAASAADRRPPRPLDLHLVSTNPQIPPLRGVSAVFSGGDAAR